MIQSLAQVVCELKIVLRSAGSYKSTLEWPPPVKILKYSQLQFVEIIVHLVFEKFLGRKEVKKFTTILDARNNKFKNKITIHFLASLKLIKFEISEF